MFSWMELSALLRYGFVFSMLLFLNGFYTILLIPLFVIGTIFLLNQMLSHKGFTWQNFELWDSYFCFMSTNCYQEAITDFNYRQAHAQNTLACCLPFFLYRSQVQGPSH